MLYRSFSLDEVNYKLAYEIFESAINIGSRNTIKHLQRSLNTLNFNTKTNDREVYPSSYGVARFTAKTP